MPRGSDSSRGPPHDRSRGGDELLRDEIRRVENRVLELDDERALAVERLEELRRQLTQSSARLEAMSASPVDALHVAVQQMP